MTFMGCFILDNTDKKLIALMAGNARISLHELSKKVFLSPPAVASRIEKLEKNGIIEGYVLKLNPEKLGFSLLAFIELTMAPAEIEIFLEFIKDNRNVLECYHMAGAYSMLMKVMFHNSSALYDFVGQLQKFGKTQTQMVFKQVIETRLPGIDGAE